MGYAIINLGYITFIIKCTLLSWRSLTLCNYGFK